MPFDGGCMDKRIWNDDKHKNPTFVNVRPLTREEILTLSYGDHPTVILNNGRLGRVKINGKVRTWKRDAERIEVPVKYGMYECATLTGAELERFVKVED